MTTTLTTEDSGHVGNPSFSDDQTDAILDGSLTVKFNTLDVRLLNPSQTYLDIGQMVVLTDPAWSGPISALTYTQHEKGTDLICALTATNTDTPSSSAAGFGLSDTPNNTTTFGYRDLNIKLVGFSDGSEVEQGSLTTFKGGLAPGMTFTLTNAEISPGITFIVTQVTTTWQKKGDPVYAVEFTNGDLPLTMGSFLAAPADSFPPAPPTGSRTFRTDLGMEFYYDGTRWLSTTLFIFNLSAGNWNAGLSATTAGILLSHTPVGFPGASDIYLVSHVLEIFVNGGTALSGSHKWVGTLNKRIAANTDQLVDTTTINSGSSSVWRTFTNTLNVLLSATAAGYIFAQTWTKTGTPGNLFITDYVTFRVVAA